MDGSPDAPTLLVSTCCLSSNGYMGVRYHRTAAPGRQYQGIATVEMRNTLGLPNQNLGFYETAEEAAAAFTQHAMTFFNKKHPTVAASHRGVSLYLSMSNASGYAGVKEEKKHHSLRRRFLATGPAFEAHGPRPTLGFYETAEDAAVAVAHYVREGTAYGVEVALEKNKARLAERQAEEALEDTRGAQARGLVTVTEDGLRLEVAPSETGYRGVQYARRLRNGDPKLQAGVVVRARGHIRLGTAKTPLEGAIMYARHRDAMEAVRASRPSAPDPPPQPARSATRKRRRKEEAEEETEEEEEEEEAEEAGVSPRFHPGTRVHVEFAHGQLYPGVVRGVVGSPPRYAVLFDDGDELDDVLDDELRPAEVDVAEAAAVGADTCTACCEGTAADAATVQRQQPATAKRRRRAPSWTWTTVVDDGRCSLPGCALARYHTGACIGPSLADETSGVRLRSRRAGRGGSASLGEDDASGACAICFERAVGDEDAGPTACGHLFHRACLRRWLEECKAGKQTLSCAVCRQPISVSSRRMFAPL